MTGFSNAFRGKALSQKSGKFNPFAGSAAAMAVNERAMNQMVKNHQWNTGKKPHRMPTKLHIPAPHPGSKGWVIGDMVQKKGSPRHRSLVDHQGGHTFWEVLQAILRGAIKLGDLVSLAVTGMGEVLFEVTDGMVQAARNTVGRAGRAVNGSLSDLDHWLGANGAVIMIGGWALVILAAIVVV